MSIGILIVGPTGSGKSHSLMTMPPSSTFLINCDKKPLPWRNSMQQYKKMHNYIEERVMQNLAYHEPMAAAHSKAELVKPASERDYSRIRYPICSNNEEEMSWIKIINEKLPHIKSAVVDTANIALIDLEMSDKFRNRGSAKGAGDGAFKKWYDLASEGWGLFNIANDLRDDLIVYIMAHSTESVDSDTDVFRKMVTNGRKLEKLTPESLFSIVLHSVKDTTKDTKECFFETYSGNSTAKAPDGMFKDQLIPNNLKDVDTAVREYYGMEPIKETNA